MTKRQKLLQDIIFLITGLIIPVSFTHQDCSRVFNQLTCNQYHVVKKVTPKKFVFSYKFDYWPEIYNYLTIEQKIVWKNYSALLFSILHEIGHVYTLVGLDYSRVESEKNMAWNSSKSYNERCAMYRKTKAESLADQWATDWVLEHTELAKELDKKLVSFK